MYSFLANVVPHSINAQHNIHYRNALITAFQQHNQNAKQLTSELYGFVYYFYRVNTGIDADNLSKPIWDALRTHAYPDDSNIRFRSAGIYDLNSVGIEELDISNMDSDLFADLLQMIDNKDNHIIYVEIGNFDIDLFLFGYEKKVAQNGNP